MSYLIRISLVIICLLVMFNSVEISIGQSDANLAQKKKVYCSMISYHFLDDHNSTIETFTKGMSEFRSKLFKHKVAKKLSQNCQQQISTQQIMELSRFVNNLSGHEKELFDIQNKYVEYFSPEDGIVLRFYEQVKAESDVEVNKQLQKFNQARRQIEENTQIVVEGFREIEKHIDQQGQFIITFMQQMTSFAEDIHHKVFDFIQKVKNSQEIQKIQNFIDEL